MPTYVHTHTNTLNTHAYVHTCILTCSREPTRLLEAGKQDTSTYTNRGTRSKKQALSFALPFCSEVHRLHSQTRGSNTETCAHRTCPGWDFALIPRHGSFATSRVSILSLACLANCNEPVGVKCQNKNNGKVSAPTEGRAQEALSLRCQRFALSTMSFCTCSHESMRVMSEETITSPASFCGRPLYGFGGPEEAVAAGTLPLFSSLTS